ncbi:Hypothetical predicted protein, partial [Olea europaea subsp. europaea]
TANFTCLHFECHASPPGAKTTCVFHLRIGPSPGGSSRSFPLSGTAVSSNCLGASASISSAHCNTIWSSNSLNNAQPSSTSRLGNSTI